MAQKKQTIEYRSNSGTSFAVWTDLPDTQIKTIEGVVSIGSAYLDGRREVYFDPRYDIEDIKCELTALATQQAAVALDAFTQHPRPGRESWPGHCGMDTE